MRLGNDGNLPWPWMGDPVSADIADIYSRKIMNGDESAYACLCAYRDELRTVAVALGEMESGYRRIDASGFRMGRDV